jgi:hypothetical protein
MILKGDTICMYHPYFTPHIQTLVCSDRFNMYHQKRKVLSAKVILFEKFKTKTRYYKNEIDFLNQL